MTIKKIINALLYTTTATFSIQSLHAQQNAQAVNTAITAAPFLRISPDARSGGMGETGIGSSPDAASGFYNLAKTPFTADKHSLSVTYSPWMRDIADDVYLLSAAGYQHLSDDQTISASLRYFNIGDLPVIDYNGYHLTSAQPKEWAFDLGYARKLSADFGLSLAMRYIYSDLGAGSSSGANYHAGKALAADIAFYYHGTNEQGKGWNFGAALSNLGSRISYTDNADRKDLLPADLGIGGGYTALFDEDDKLGLTAELRKSLVPDLPQDSAGIAAYYQKGLVQSWFNSFKNIQLQYHVGLEYVYKDIFFLRAGYSIQGQSTWPNGGFTCGLGLAYSIVGIDLSYLAPSGSGDHRNPLSNTVRFGVTFRPDRQHHPAPRTQP